jgi:hypothetical protein
MSDDFRKSRPRFPPLPRVDLPSPPPQPITKNMGKVEVPAGQLEAILLELKSVREEGKATHREMIAFRRETTERVNRHSEGVRKLSDTNSDQDNAIGALVVEMQEVKGQIKGFKDSLKTNTEATLAIKTKVVDGVENFWKRNPKVETAVVALILAACAFGTSCLMNHR